eukprot:scaffold310563_cov27-Tisochrysis_lutea.AAC.1
MLAARRSLRLRRAGVRGVFGGPDEFAVARATARRRRFDALLLGLRAPDAAVAQVVESVVAQSLSRHAPHGALASADSLAAAVSEALPRLAQLQTAPLTRQISTTDVAKAAAHQAPAAAKAAVAAEHEAALATAREMTKKTTDEGASGNKVGGTAVSEATIPAPATPADVYASGEAPVAQHNAAVAALAAGAPRPSPAEGSAEGDGSAASGKSSSEEVELVPDVLTMEEMTTVHAMRVAAALTALEQKPWGALRLAAAEVAPVTTGGGDGSASAKLISTPGVHVGGLLELARSLSSGDTLTTMQVYASAMLVLHLLLANSVQNRTHALPSRFLSKPA